MVPNVGLIIVNWNSGKLLRKCLESLGCVRSDSYALQRIIVVDNASSDGSTENLDFPKLPLEVRCNAVNHGFASACNQGAEGLHSDYLLFLNPDTCLFKTSITAAVDFLEQPENSEVGILGIQLFDEAGILQRSCARFPTPWRVFGQSIGLDRLWPSLAAPHFMHEWAHDETRPVDQVMGAYFLVRRDVYEALGGFDERFFVYFEDVDFCLRARQKGWATIYFSGAHAMHVGNGTTAAVPVLRLFFNLRSRILFGRKHFGLVGQVTVLIATAILEPLSRIIRAIGRGSVKEIRNVGAAAAMLYLATLRGLNTKAP